MHSPHHVSIKGSPGAAEESKNSATSKSIAKYPIKASFDIESIAVMSPTPPAVVSSIPKMPRKRIRANCVLPSIAQKVLAAPFTPGDVLAYADRQIEIFRISARMTGSSISSWSRNSEVRQPSKKPRPTSPR